MEKKIFTVFDWTAIIRNDLCCLRALILLLILSGLPRFLIAQQVPDTTFQFPLEHPSYSAGKGPVVFIDEGHHNFHTRSGGFLPFARLVNMDGYRVNPIDQVFSASLIPDNCDILVIANALDGSDTRQWISPNPSAFTTQEIETIRQWVYEGGSLFLIADHMPFAGIRERSCSRLWGSGDVHSTNCQRHPESRLQFRNSATECSVPP